MRHLGIVCALVTAFAAYAPTCFAQAQWSVDSVPLVDIGGRAQNGETMFEYPRGATRLSSGIIVVADGYGTAVRFFDAMGRLVRTVGGSGNAAGEFRRVWWLGQCGPDSVHVWDILLRRASVIDSTGTVVDVYPIPSNPGKGKPPGIHLSCSRSGIFGGIAEPQFASGFWDRNGDWIHFKSPLWVTDARGNVIVEYGDVPVGEARCLGKVTQIANTDRHLYVGTQDSGFVDVYGLDGSYVGAIEVDVMRRPATQLHYERAADDRMMGYSDVETRVEQKPLMLEWPMPEYLPPYSSLLTDQRGILWAVLSSLGDPDTRLRAISETGSPITDVVIPMEVRVFEVGDGYILGAYADADGAAHVAMFRLHRGR